MAIIKVTGKKPKREVQMVGVEIPQSQYNLLTLAALSRGVTRMTIFRELLNQWETEQYEGEILREILTKLREQWVIEQKKNPNASIAQFLMKTEAWLNHRRIEQDYINMITKMFLNAEG